MKVSFIIGHDNREFLRKAIKHEFYTRNCKKYSRIIRDNIFDLDYYAGKSRSTIFEIEYKFMIDLMHTFIGERGNFVVGLEQYIKDKAFWFVDSVVESYYRKNYPEYYID